MNFRSSIITLFALFGTISLFSKTIYIRYDAACMDRLEYRLNDNMAGNGLIAYSLKANDTERVVMEIGVESIKQIKRIPRGTKTCGKVKVNELLANSINSGKDKVFIVRKTGKYYTVSPVHLATYMKDSPTTFVMRGNQFDMSYAANDIGVMENNLAKGGSPTKVYFIGSEQQVCSDAYRIKKIPEETCKPYTDLTFLPGLGILEEKTGTNQAEAENNILRLVKVNNLPLAEYINQKCNGGATLAAVPQPATMEEETPKFRPATRNKPAAKPEKKEPASFEVVFPADLQAPAPEYQPAGVELVQAYDQPQKPLETFRPRGVNCKELSYAGVHIVQSNQTLYSISRQYNVTVKQLREWNNMENKDLIQPCASLYVLPPTTVAANTATADNPTTNPTTPSQETFTPRGTTGNAEVLFRNTPEANTANSIPVTPSRNVNSTPTTSSSVQPDAIYANAAKQSEVLFPKSGPTPTDYSATSATIQPKDGCDKLAYDGVHIVQKGETLYSIATKNGLTVKQVQTWNKLGDNAKIKPCMSLYVKTPEAVIAAVNTPKGGTNEENYTIPGSEISPGYTNTPSEATVPKGGTEGQVLNNTNIGRNAATIGATDKMWNSGIEYHVVQKGETLVSLAKMYGFTLERFRDINGLGDANIIRIGQVLRTGNCLCPANGVGPTNSTDITAKSGNTSTIASSNENNVTTTTPTPQSQNAENTSTITERATDFEPVPVPYDYETESILNQSKRGNTVSYRNGRKVHTVQENETMATIANKYNLPIELLRKLNKMEAGEIVIPDMKIYLE